LRFLEREMVEQSELFANIFLSKFPIAHKTLRPKIAMRGMNAIRNRRILGCGEKQVNALGSYVFPNGECQKAGRCCPESR
jgi:hypothetical protein